MFGADLVYISGLSNESADCFPDIVAHARQTGALVATNPGIRQLTSRSSSFHAALSGIDVLAVNRNEADALVPQLVGQFGEGGPTPDLEGSADVCPELILRGLRSGGHEMSLSRFVSALCGCGVGQVVVTNGGDGAYVGDRTQLSHCPALPTRIAGTAGAGDAFGSTFAAWFASKGDAVIALQAGVLNSASVIGHADTQSGLLNARELDGRLVEAADQLAVRSWSLESDLP